MRMRAPIAILVTGALILAVALGACAPKGPEELTDGAEIARTRCSGCHDLERIKSAGYDRVGWQLAVSRMIAKGAILSDNEAATLIDFLATGGASQL